MLPVVRELIWGVVGFVLGALLTVAVRAAVGLEPWVFGPLFVVGYLFGLAGWLLGVGVWDTWLRSDLPADMHLHDTFWVVSHFHYTIVGGGIFGLFVGLYYWFPKMTGRMYSERLGRLHFWLMFVLFNLVFAPMTWLGLNGMNRRIGDYAPNLAGVNLFVSLMAFALGLSFLIFVYNFVVSWVRGPVAEANPWGVRTLEWATSSPPPEHNFPRVPEVVGWPYDYGVPGAMHAKV